MDIFKMQEGFNTDIFYAGQVFYAEYEYEEYTLGQEMKKTFKGNIIISRCDPYNMVFRSIREINEGVETHLRYDTVKCGAVKIMEMRLLK